MTTTVDSPVDLDDLVELVGGDIQPPCSWVTVRQVPLTSPEEGRCGKPAKWIVRSTCRFCGRVVVDLICDEHKQILDRADRRTRLGCTECQRLAPPTRIEVLPL